MNGERVSWIKERCKITMLKPNAKTALYMHINKKNEGQKTYITNLYIKKEA